MATLQSIKAWRYNPILSEDLKPIVGTLSETMFRQKASALYRMPFHHYHISSPADVPPFENASRRIAHWKLDKVLWQDALPSIYVYAQDFLMQGEPKQRIGFVASIQLEEYANQVIFPHELTIPKAVEYRSQLLEATQMHTLPTHGFYTDEDCQLEAMMQESLQNTIYDVLDSEQVRHRLSVIQDKKCMQLFQEVLKNKKVWIADGHHRYESSLRYRNRRRIQESAEDNEQAWQFHLMWLTNTQSSEAGILPTHRILKGLPNFEAEKFMEQLSHHFDIEALPPDSPPISLEKADKWTFQVLFPSQQYQITLKKDHFATFGGGLAPEVKALEVSVLHHFILEKCLGLVGDAQFAHLDFLHEATKCYKEVLKPHVNCALLTRAVTLTEIEEVCFQEHTMPVKSTYFYPKVLGGLLFSSLIEEEFEKI